MGYRFLPVQPYWGTGGQRDSIARPSNLLGTITTLDLTRLDAPHPRLPPDPEDKRKTRVIGR